MCSNVKAHIFLQDCLPHRLLISLCSLISPSATYFLDLIGDQRLDFNIIWTQCRHGDVTKTAGTGLQVFLILVVGK